MTRHEWVSRVAAAWADEPCPVCGYVHGVVDVEPDGVVVVVCDRTDRSFPVARTWVPTFFDAELGGDRDLPF